MSSLNSSPVSPRSKLYSVVLTIVQGKDLAKRDRIGKGDPYVVATFVRCSLRLWR